MPAATAILAALTAAAQLEPVIQELVPLVQKALAGNQFNDEDLAALAAVADKIDAAVLAKLAPPA